jgi:hypothetical protein
MVAQEEEWQLYTPEKEIPVMPEVPSKIPVYGVRTIPLDQLGAYLQW